jgi:hypothetical protein
MPTVADAYDEERDELFLSRLDELVGPNQKQRSLIVTSVLVWLLLHPPA